MSVNIDRPCGIFDRNYHEAKELFRTPLRKGLLALLIVALYLLPFWTNCRDGWIMGTGWPGGLRMNLGKSWSECLLV